MIIKDLIKDKDYNIEDIVNYFIKMETVVHKIKYKRRDTCTSFDVIMFDYEGYYYDGRVYQIYNFYTRKQKKK